MPVCRLLVIRSRLGSRTEAPYQYSCFTDEVGMEITYGQIIYKALCRSLLTDVPCLDEEAKWAEGEL